MNTKIIKFDLNKYKLYENIKAKQKDTKSRFLLFQLLDGSIPFDLTNRSVRAYMIKPDGNEIFNDLIINNYSLGYCTLELTNQVLAVPGKVKIELMITEEDKKLTSSVFELEVIKSINSEKSIVSTNEFTALLNGLASLSEYDNYKNSVKAMELNKADKATVEEKFISVEEKIKNNSEQLDKNVQQIRENSIIDFTIEKLKNVSLTSKAPTYGEIYNLMKYSEEWDNTWLPTSHIVVDDVITIDGIKLTKVKTNNYYHEIVTNSSGVGLTLESNKKYMCSAYCYTKGKPFFFYHQYDNSYDNHATYCDNTLRRFYFIIDGLKPIKWFVQGESGLNYTGTDYNTDFYLGGFQVEKIEDNVKNGIIVIGDSTVQGSAGTWDLMRNTEWTKLLGSLLNVDYYNRGIGGNTTQQMIDRWTTDITPLKDKAKYIIILGGINDLSSKTSDEIVNNHKTMHQLAVNDGLIPIHCNITPCNKTGNIEAKRLEVNSKLKELYPDLLDISSLLTDCKENNKLIQLDGWKGDDVHYDQKAKLYVADYIVKSYNWEFRLPKKYQKVNNFDYSLDINKTEFDIYKKGTNTVKCKIKDYYDGTMIELFDDNGVSGNIHYKYGALDIEGKEINITPNTTTNFNKKSRFNDELVIPNKAPTNLLLNQLYVKDGKLYITIDYVEHEIQLVN